MSPRELLTVEQIAASFGCARKSVYRYGAAGKLGPEYMVFGARGHRTKRYERAAVERFSSRRLCPAPEIPKQKQVRSKPRPLKIVVDLDDMLRSTLATIDVIEAANSKANANGKTLFSREQVLALIEHNLCLRDIQWHRFQHRRVDQGTPDGYIDIPPTIPSRDPSTSIPELKRDENGEIP